MNILEETQNLITKYDLRPNSYVDEDAEFSKRYSPTNEEFKKMLIFAWSEKVVPNYSGIDLWNWPTKWVVVMIDFLSLLLQDSPDFVIYNLKAKFGCLRAYIGNISTESQEAIDLLEEVLRDENLIY